MKKAKWLNENSYPLDLSIFLDIVFAEKNGSRFSYKVFHGPFK